MINADITEQYKTNINLLEKTTKTTGHNTENVYRLEQLKLLHLQYTIFVKRF